MPQPIQSRSAISTRYSAFLVPVVAGLIAWAMFSPLPLGAQLPEPPVNEVPPPNEQVYDEHFCDDEEVAAAANAPEDSSDTPGTRATAGDTTGMPNRSSERLWSPGDAQTGTLLLSSAQPGRYRAAPALATRVEIRVAGLVARATVIQRFHNPDDAWVEGIYVFPLPEDAAVDGLRMRIGDRVLTGEIRERTKAKKQYEKAKRAGKKASLVEQERPNLFTASVANLGPGETLEVEIDYQQEVRYDLGRFSLRFPMTVTPRFNPGVPSAATPAKSGMGWGVATSQVPDAQRITPPYLASSHTPDGSVRNPMELRVEIDAGFELAQVASPSHGLKVDALGRGRYDVELRRDQVPANRDFVLEWEPPPGHAPRAALFTQRFGGEEYALLMVLPPTVPVEQIARLPRETIFVLDTSGSMGGASIRQAKAALITALRELRPEDHFNVIDFDSSARPLFPDSQPVTSATLSRATSWIEGLDSGGGTNIYQALEVALASQDVDRGLRQVIFLTDGAVGNETALFAKIEQSLGRSRLFTVGIGSAPNSHFMREAARFGRGTFTYIGKIGEVQTRMVELFAKIESPVMRDLQVVWDDPQAETFPARVGDLYLGEPLVAVARLPVGGGGALVRGFRPDAMWQEKFELAGGDGAAGLDKLWARRKIGTLLDQRPATEADSEARRQAVVELGLRHHLVTPHTSLVAVDHTPTAPPGAQPDPRAVPLHPPAGSTPGSLPQTATPAALARLLGLLLLLTGLTWRTLGARRQADHPAGPSRTAEP